MPPSRQAQHKAWNFDTGTVNNTMTLYAKWEVLPDISIEDIEVPSASFQMGSDDVYSEDDELPVHKVSVPPFYIGKYEVTQEQVEGGYGAWEQPIVF